MEIKGRDNGDGSYTISDTKSLHELSWTELREMNDRFKLEYDPTKRSLKEMWIRQSVFLKKHLENDSFPDEDHETVTHGFVFGIEETVFKSLGLDKDILFFQEKYGERFDGLSWEEYFVKHNSKGYNFDF